jgi:hypothetical protein
MSTNNMSANLQVDKNHPTERNTRSYINISDSPLLHLDFHHQPIHGGRSPTHSRSNTPKHSFFGTWRRTHSITWTKPKKKHYSSSGYLLYIYASQHLRYLSHCACHSFPHYKQEQEHFARSTKTRKERRRSLKNKRMAWKMPPAGPASLTHYDLPLNFLAS